MARVIPLLFTFLTVVFGIITWGIGINTCVKANRDNQRNSLFSTAIVITTVSALIWILALAAHIQLIATGSNRVSDDVRSAGHRGIMRTFSLILGFLSLWLFTVAIPFDVFTHRQGQGGRRYVVLSAIFPWITLLFSVPTTVILWNFASKHSNWASGFLRDKSQPMTSTAPMTGTGGTGPVTAAPAAPAPAPGPNYA